MTSFFLLCYFIIKVNGKSEIILYRSYFIIIITQKVIIACQLPNISLSIQSNYMDFLFLRLLMWERKRVLFSCRKQESSEDHYLYIGKFAFVYISCLCLWLIFGGSIHKAIESVQQIYIPRVYLNQKYHMQKQKVQLWH